MMCCLTWTARADSKLSKPVKAVLQDRCTECHNEDLKKGGLNLQPLITSFNARRDLDTWVKVESMVVRGKMPPKGEKALAKRQVKLFKNWFDRQFVRPDGVQHAGPSRPRRLTREELQNSLEDILHIKIRTTVTNSRLHVIPDTIVEKFFASGVLGDSGFSNDAITLSKESVNIQNYARCFSLVLTILDSDEAARKHLFGSAQLPKSFSLASARKTIARFGASAFRRPMTDGEVAAFAKVYEKMVVNRTPYEAIKSSFLAILLSPRFLYRFEQPETGRTLVVGDELAVRLSYFLWSSPPDKRLLELAATGKLREPAVLREQTRRMLADTKRVALSENLGGEWFGYKQLRQQSSVNKRSDKMAGFYRTQYEEALLFFDSLIRYDQPIFSLVDADWAYINRHQSNIYRIRTQKKSFLGMSPLPPINIHYRDTARRIKRGGYEYKHAPLRLVKLTDPNLGGLVTLGPTMSVTSTPNRTSPIRRGVWVMERILGTHFEQPKDVPDLEATQKKAKNKRLNLSHNELLKLHSSQKGCASCHQYIDPIGFGLETFDQLGIRRSLSIPNPSGETLTWNPKQTPRKFAARTWKLTRPLVPGKNTRVFFQYTKGRHRLDIRNVRLESGKIKLKDGHFGFTGNQNRNNVWFFSIPKNAPKTGWKLIADIQGNGGTNSHGRITVSGPNSKRPTNQLPNGKPFATPAEFKKLLLSDYKEKIIDNVVRRVLVYALGREVDPVDRPAIQQIKKSIKSKHYRMNALIEAVVLSYPFRHKENR